MQHVLYLLLRRLRTPIIALISVYAICVLGFTLIPGQDLDGNPWRMDFFHAFYFVSFMGSTIGFGEIPYPFTPMQRGWTTVSVYATVLTWLYGVGTIFALFQDSNVRRLIQRTNFARRVAKIHRPFYLVCGCGVTGQRITKLLDDHGINSVVIENDQVLFDRFEGDELSLSVPGICADAADPEILALAGIQDPLCIGVLAITNNDHTNLSIAIDSKLVMPERLVISATQSKETTANLNSFGTDYIIDPFGTFADQLYLTLRQPYKHLLHDLIVNPNHNVLASPHQKTEGRWVICGYGRFGQALEKKFLAHGIEMTFIEPDPSLYKIPAGSVQGVGTEAKTLLEANITGAVGIIAGTPDDADNLSIIITARDLKPDLITVARQNKDANKPMFRAADVNMIMQPGRAVANEIYMLIRTPMLMQFFNAAREKDREWSRQLLMRITDVLQDQPLDTWACELDSTNAPAVSDWLDRDGKLSIAALYRDPRNRDNPLSAVPVLLKRGDISVMEPSDTTELLTGDQILFCGQRAAHTHINWTLSNHNALRYIITGRYEPGGHIWRYLRRKWSSNKTDERISEESEKNQ